MNNDEKAALIEALEWVLEAWDYNGGGDKWTRECFGEQVAKARKALEKAKQSNE